VRPILALLAGPAVAEEPAKPAPHADEQVAPALAQFKKDFAAKDLDQRLRALRTFGRWRHKDVLRELRRIFLKDEDLEIKAAAAEGLGFQTANAAESGRTLIDALEQWKDWATLEDPEGDAEVKNEDEARVLIAAINAVGGVGHKDGWKTLKGFVDHRHDFVAAATMATCGKLKEYRALPLLLEWFNLYPDGYSWSGGSVRVDTGAAGGADQAAAEAKWRAKFGSMKKKARPNTVEAMIKALKDITGVEFEKPDQLKQWMEDNKLLLRKHGL
jgi:hypothetical protein